MYQCPSDVRGDLISDNGSGPYEGGGSGPHRAALTSYLGVSGRNSYREYQGMDGILHVNAGVKMATIYDGTSNTLLVGERPPSNDLYYGWMWAGSGDAPYFGATDVALGVREIISVPTTGYESPPGTTLPPMNQNPYVGSDFYRPGTLN